MTTATCFCLQGAAVHGVDAPSHSLYVSDGRIVADAPGATLNLPGDWHVVPGFIDSHIHGAMGVDVMDASADALATLAGYLPREGTTSFLATTMTAAPEHLDRVMTTLAGFDAAPGSAEMMGVHLEGPFIDPHKTGAQPVAHVQTPDVARFDRWHALSGERIRVVTLAPEQPGADVLIQRLVALGIRPSIGHSGCSAAAAEAALKAGATRATHLFNAMEGLHHREPGAACAALASPGCVCEIIADGLHVAPAMVDLAWRMKGDAGLMAITDAMRAKGLGDGEYDLGGQAVQVTGGQARLADGTLAGSILTFDQAFRNLRAFTSCDMAGVIAMTSTNAARDLSVADRKGRLDVGFDADVVVLDDDWQVRLTICRGVVAYDPGGLMQTLD